MNPHEKTTNIIKILSADICVKNAEYSTLGNKDFVETTNFFVHEFPSVIKFYVKARVFFKRFNPNTYLYVQYNKYENPDDYINNIEEHQGNISVNKMEHIYDGEILHILTSLTGIDVTEDGIYRAQISMREFETEKIIDSYNTYFIVDALGK